ncbi:transglutaminase family protein [Catenovulum sp. 2E275]|uniref:transglutaminase family protein n=1 Tax=Catenovulum sp. 2E275 TaxID=2980497 RepID=UPI0021CEA767|nr:transglutaminase family protein [Catenovulum sp. 2E275]MCU4674117.1 transglutaminase family protein [Catenovulum sp. 2E275]
MKYKVKHSTTYSYSEPVSLCQNQARLSPISNEFQRCISNQVITTPAADYLDTFVDYFGNKVTVFDIPTQHENLIVTAISEVEIFNRQQASLFDAQITWESVVAALQFPVNELALQAAEFTLPSVFTPIDPQIRQYAFESFTPGRAIIQATEDLMARIFNDFQYESGFTTISTPLSEVFAHKKGVCQDFAHFALACLRSLGLAARYVSGYIETLPPEGQVKLEGADATHAWFAIYVPDLGWIDFDPTNNVLPNDQHITLAVGRDFADVTPLKGIVFGGGTHQLLVAVDMNRQGD